MPAEALREGWVLFVANHSSVLSTDLSTVALAKEEALAKADVSFVSSCLRG